MIGIALCQLRATRPSRLSHTTSASSDGPFAVQLACVLFLRDIKWGFLHPAFHLRDQIAYGAVPEARTVWSASALILIMQGEERHKVGVPHQQ